MLVDDSLEWAVGKTSTDRALRIVFGGRFGACTGKILNDSVCVFAVIEHVAFGWVCQRSEAVAALAARNGSTNGQSTNVHGSLEDEAFGIAEEIEWAFGEFFLYYIFNIFFMYHCRFIDELETNVISLLRGNCSIFIINKKSVLWCSDILIKWDNGI